MKSQQHLSLWIVCGVAAALALVAVVFLVRFNAQYRAVAGDLKSSLARLAQLHGRKPYPNEDNIRLSQEKLDLKTALFEQIRRSLAVRQFVSPPIEPAEFPLRLQRARGELTRVANVARVRFGGDERGFMFGFDRYKSGQPPRREDIRHLTRQLHYVGSVCRVIFAANVDELTSIERFGFESVEVAPVEEPGLVRGRRHSLNVEPPPEESAVLRSKGAFYVSPDGLFVRERMAFNFRCREASLWQILNRLAAMDAPFCAVSRLDVVNEAPKPATRDIAAPTAPAYSGLPGYGAPEPTPTPAPGSPGAEEGGPRLPSHEERVVAGRDDLLRVRMEVDLYHFGASEAATEESQP